MKQTLLIGNGISKLLNPIDLDWKSVLSETLSPNNKLLGASNNQELVPYTHMYEDILLNDKYKHNFNGSDDLTELKSNIKNHLMGVLSKSQNSDFDDITKQLIELNVDNILTTNYEYTLDKVLIENGFSTQKTRQQTIYSTRRKYHYNNSDGRELDLWYIHGELNYIKSIMLGYDHYCGSLTKISDYIKNGKLSDNERDNSTSLLQEDKDVHHIVKKCYLHQSGINVDCATWMDTFFFSDVHILGLGLDFQEIDLWWLLNKRYRYIKTAYALPSQYQNLIISNNIYYYGKVSKEVKVVLDAYGVNTEYAYDSDIYVEDWPSFYREAINTIKININQRKQNLFL